MAGVISSWIVAPITLALVCCGLSLLVERALDLGLPWTLRPALGMAVLIVLAQLGTLTGVTAPLTLPLIAVLGILGLAVGWVTRPDRSRRGDVQDGWGVAAGVAVFALYGLPFFVRGEATWTGYIKLDDTATFMAMADWAFEHGRGVPEQALGSFAVIIQDNLGIGYPIGSFSAAAFMGWLPGQDIAWVIQPGMAFGAACLATALFEIGRRLLHRAEVAAAIGLVATLSALFLGYYLWGGVKELAAAPLIALGPAIMVAARDARANSHNGRLHGGGERPIAWTTPRLELRLGLLLGVVAAALIGSLGLGGAIWIAPIYLGLALATSVRSRREGALRLIGGGLLSAIPLGLPSVITPSGFYNPLQGGLTSDSELGNLAEALNPLQIAGLWPALDFRQDPSAPLTVTVLICCVFAAGVWITWRKRRGLAGGALTALMVGGLVAAMVTVLVSSPWVGAKALATFSPFVLFAGLCGMALLAQEARLGLVAGLAAGLGIAVTAVALWGAADAYHGISFAPRAHYEELDEIADRFAGQGPALSTEVSVSGPRHFLREVDANSAGGRRAYEVLTRSGEPHPAGEYLDISEIRPDQLLLFPLIITRRSPVESRPPSEFELAWEGRYYEVWRQIGAEGEGSGSGGGDGTVLVQDLNLGWEEDPGAVPECTDVRAVAEMVGPEGVLRAAPAGPPPLVIKMSQAELEPGWEILGENQFSPLGPGEAHVTIEVTQPGRFSVWVGGEIYAGLRVGIGGKAVGGVRGAVNNGGAYEPLGKIPGEDGMESEGKPSGVYLEAGRHQIHLVYSGTDFYPGSGFQGTWSPFPVGPIILEPEHGVTSHPSLVEVPASQYRRLCGQRWDWIEARKTGTASKT